MFMKLGQLDSGSHASLAGNQLRRWRIKDLAPLAQQQRQVEPAGT